MRKLLLFTVLTLYTTLVFSEDYKNMPDDELVVMAESGDIEAQYYLGQLIEDLIYTENHRRLDYIDRKPFIWYEKAAGGGHPDAMTIIAKEYLSSYGHYRKTDLNYAVQLLDAAKEKNSEAALILSILYYHGKGVEQNTTTALELLDLSQKDFYRVKPLLYLEREFITMVRELVKEKNSHALFMMADFYYFGKTGYYDQSYTKAYRLYTQSSELGNSSASYMVGMMLYSGVGVLKDLNESFAWITKSAEEGNESAIIKAGIMNYFGEGTEVNFEAAHRWFTIGAIRNDSLSQYFIGVMYYKGEGVDKNLDLSRKWIKKAYENGSESAKKFWDAKELWN